MVAISVMPVYFIHQISTGEPRLKIGRANDIFRRRDILQTGNPETLVLVGWINSNSESALEAKLHRKYSARRTAGEWFRLEPAEILEDLKWAGSNGFVARNADAFEIVGHDRDAIPEHLGVWEWSDLELDECCPFCGSLCGMHFQEASQAYNCISCRRLSDSALPLLILNGTSADIRKLAMAISFMHHNQPRLRRELETVHGSYEPRPSGRRKRGTWRARCRWPEHQRRSGSASPHPDFRGGAPPCGCQG